MRRYLILALLGLLAAGEAQAKSPPRDILGIRLGMRESEVHARLARMGVEAGYEPAKLEREPGGLAIWWQGFKQLPLRLHALGCYAHMAWRARDARNFDSEKSNQLWHRLNPPAWQHYPGFELPPAPPLPSRMLPAA